MHVMIHSNHGTAKADIYYGFNFLVRQLPKGKYDVYKG